MDTVMGMVMDMVMDMAMDTEGPSLHVKAKGQEEEALLALLMLFDDSECHRIQSMLIKQIPRLQPQDKLQNLILIRTTTMVATMYTICTLAKYL